MNRSTGLTLATILLTVGGLMAQQADSSGREESSSTSSDAVADFGESNSQLVIPQEWPYATQSKQKAMTAPVPSAQTEATAVSESRPSVAQVPVVDNFVQIRPRMAKTDSSSTKPQTIKSSVPVTPKPWPFTASNEVKPSNLPPKFNPSPESIAPEQAPTVATFTEPVSTQQTKRAEAADWWKQTGPVPYPQPLEDELPSPGPEPSAEVQNDATPNQQPIARHSDSPRNTPSHYSTNSSASQPSETTRRRNPVATRRNARVRNRASLEVISRHANDHVRYGFDLAEKGAVHSARGEFVEALSIIADALEVEGDASYRTALISGLRALDEANDFARQGKPLESAINFSRLKEIHKTPVLDEVDVQTLTPYVAMQRYFAFAERQLAYAGGGAPAASRALYGLGRIQPYLAGQDGPGNTLAGPKGIALHRAALITDPRNHQAANELGVQLARYGQLAAAADVLKHSLSVRPVPEAWHNLARVYEQQGNEAQARLARSQHATLIASARQGRNTDVGAPAIRWVEPAEFSPPSASGIIAQNRSSAKAPKEPANGNPAAPASVGPIQRIGQLFGRSPRR